MMERSNQLSDKHDSKEQELPGYFTLNKNDSAELEFLSDYFDFGRVVRFYHALALYDKYIESELDYERRLFGIGIYFQLVVLFEDIIILVTALRQKHLEDTPVFETIAKSHKKGERKRSENAMINGTVFADIGFTNYRRKNVNKYGLTQTAIKEIIKVLKVGFFRIVERYEFHKENYNKIKHGCSVIGLLDSFDQSFPDELKKWTFTLQNHKSKESDDITTRGHGLINTEKTIIDGAMRNIARMTDLTAEILRLFVMFHYPENKKETKIVKDKFISKYNTIKIPCEGLLINKYQFQNIL